MSANSTSKQTFAYIGQHYDRFHFTPSIRRAKRNCTMTISDSRPSRTSILIRFILRPTLVLLLSAPIIIFLLSVQSSPSVVIDRTISNLEISQIETILLDSASQSPSNAGLQEIQLNARELNLLLRYAVNVMSLPQDWAAQLFLADNALSTELSLKLLGGAIPLFLNIDGEFVANGELLTLNSLSIGKLQIPRGLLWYTLNQLVDGLNSSNLAYRNFSELLNNVKGVDISADRMHVSLYWDPVLIGKLGNQTPQLFISKQDQQRIITYYQLISSVAATIPSDIKAVSLNTFLVPLFTAAYENSLNGSDAIAESRTLFQALALYVNQEPIEQLLGPELAQQITPAYFVEIRLQRRQDLAQHLTASAAVTASAGADLAEMLSTTKEAYDARYRSGFSFSDLTANSVGVTMASLATRDVTSALLMQERMSKLQNESDYMPTVGNNRDGLSEADFSAQFTNRNSPEYQARVREIQQLIDSRPVFTGLSP